MPDLNAPVLSQRVLVPTLTGGESEGIPQMDYFGTYVVNVHGVFAESQPGRFNRARYAMLKR
jgi:hypothetical protein